MREIISGEKNEKNYVIHCNYNTLHGLAIGYVLGANTHTVVFTPLIVYCVQMKSNGDVQFTPNPEIDSIVSYHKSFTFIYFQFTVELQIRLQICPTRVKLASGITRSTERILSGRNCPRCLLRLFGLSFHLIYSVKSS